MRRNLHSVVANLMFTFSLLLLSSVNNVAEAGINFEACVDKDNRPVETRFDKNLTSYAKAMRIPTSSQAGNQYLIKVNPTRYYLSRETQQWLYFRQCAHIQLEHEDTLRSENNRANLREEKEADCWAIRKMLNENEFGFSERSISKIQRDIKELEADRDRWNEIFNSARRRVYTRDCL